MPYKINSSKPKKGCVSFDDGSELRFTYMPSAYTPNHEDMVEEAKAGGKAGSFIKAWLIPILVEWDVVEEVPRLEDGKPAMKGGKPVMEEVPVPISAEGLGKVPFEVLNDIVSAISKDMMPGEASTTSSNGSFS